MILCRIKGSTRRNDFNYRKASNIRHTLVGNEIVNHSDVVGASPVNAAPSTSSFSTSHLASKDSAKTASRQCDNLLSVGIRCALYWRFDGTYTRNDRKCLTKMDFMKTYRKCTHFPFLNKNVTLKVWVLYKKLQHRLIDGTVYNDTLLLKAKIVFMH